jgi:hypothetical protein
MATTVFDPSEGPSAEQQAAETAALEQGEKIAKLQEEDKARVFDQAEASNEDAGLIAGKFKSQEDLVKAYNELQSKLGQDTPEDEREPTEEPVEATEEVPAEETTESPEIFSTAAAQYAEKGELSEETIAELSKMDSKELVNLYVDFFNKSNQAAQQQAVDADAEKAILDSVGGKDSYQEIVSWAANNLDQAEIDSYNQVTNSGNAAAIKFAVEALSNRYKNAEGYEAPLVTGRKAATESNNRFRSHGELSRAIADPRYNTDAAYRADVEAKLSRSTDLL